jgi:hypothetical protein
VDRRGWKIPELMESSAEGEAEKSGVILYLRGKEKFLVCAVITFQMCFSRVDISVPVTVEAMML